MCYWILVPTALDQEWISLQRRAIHAEGLELSQVSHLVARIVRTHETYQLLITSIETFGKGS